jgi:uncharacterized protein YkwD
MGVRREEGCVLGRWQLTLGLKVVIGAAVVSIAAALLYTTVQSPDRPEEEQRISRAAGAVVEPEARVFAPQAAPEQETLSAAEGLEAAAQFYRAGEMLIAAPPQPPLEEVLAAVAELEGTAVLSQPEEPSLYEVLVAADALVLAGEIEAPEPSLIEVLQAADQLEQVRQLAVILEDQESARLAASAPAAAPASQVEPPAAPQPPPPPAPTSTPVPPPPPPPAPEAGSDASFNSQVLAAANAQRAAAGLPPLQWEPRLATAALRYAQLLAETGWFSHTGPDGSTLVERVEAAGFPFTVAIGEVIALGSDDWPPAEIVQAWMESAAHRDQIMNGGYTRAGVGCYFTMEGGIRMTRCVMDLAG